MPIFCAEGNAEAGVFIDFEAWLTSAGAVGFIAVLLVCAEYGRSGDATVEIEVTDFFSVTEDAVVAVGVFRAAELLATPVDLFVAAGTAAVAGGGFAGLVEVLTDDRRAVDALVRVAIAGLDAVAGVAVVALAVGSAANLLTTRTKVFKTVPTAAVERVFIADRVGVANYGCAGFAAVGRGVAGLDAIAVEGVVAVFVDFTCDLGALAVDLDVGRVASAGAVRVITVLVVAADDVLSGETRSTRDIAGLCAIAREAIIAVRVHTAVCRGRFGDNAEIRFELEAGVTATKPSVRVAAGVVLTNDLITEVCRRRHVVVVVCATGHQKCTGEEEQRGCAASSEYALRPPSLFVHRKTPQLSGSAIMGVCMDSAEPQEWAFVYDHATCIGLRVRDLGHVRSGAVTDGALVLQR